MARILIRVPNWLGDAVMATGAICDFARHRSGDEIWLAGPAYTLPAFENAPYRPQLIELDRHAAKSVRGFFAARARLRREGFERAYLLTNSFSSALLSFMAGIPLRIGYASHGRRFLLSDAVDPREAPTHQAAKYAYLFDTACRAFRPSKIFLTDEEQDRAGRMLREWGLEDSILVGFAIGAAYGGAKRWPVERYAQAARRCVDDFGAKAIFFGSEMDAPVCKQAADWAGKGAVSLAGRTDLRGLFALLRECRVLICNDSGVMHAAGAVGTPLVAIFGPTDPNATSPLGENIHIVRRPLECSPCLERECPLRHHRCMMDVTVDEVIAAAAPQFDQPDRS